MTGGLSPGRGGGHIPSSSPLPQGDFISPRCAGSTGHGEAAVHPGSCQTRVKQVSLGPRAPGRPSPSAPPPLSLCCALPAEASGMCLGSEPASSWRGLPPWLPARPWVFREIFWGGAGHTLLSESRGAPSLQRTPGHGSSLAPRHSRSLPSKPGVHERKAPPTLPGGERSGQPGQRIGSVGGARRLCQALC